MIKAALLKNNGYERWILDGKTEGMETSWAVLMPQSPSHTFSFSVPFINYSLSCPRKNPEVLHDTSLSFTPTCNPATIFVGSTSKMLLGSKLPQQLLTGFSSSTGVPLYSIVYTNVRVIINTHTQTHTHHCYGLNSTYVVSLTLNVTICRKKEVIKVIGVGPWSHGISALVRSDIRVHLIPFLSLLQSPSLFLSFFFSLFLSPLCVYTEERPCKETTRKWLSASEGESSFWNWPCWTLIWDN